MKISILGPVYPYRGGIAHYTALLAEALIEDGCQVQILSFKRQYPSWLYPGASDKDPSQDAVQVPAEYLLDPFLPGTWYKTAQAIQAFNPDLVIIHWWTTFWTLPFGFLAARLRRIGFKTTFLIHNVMPHETRPWDLWLARWALKNGQHYIVQTKQEADRLQQVIPGADLRLCPHPIYTKLASASLPMQAARKQLGWPQDKTIFLFFGIVRQYKGLHLLLEALGIMRRQGISPILVVAGEFWDDKTAYLKQIHDLNLSEQVILMDQYIPNEQVATLFSAADCLVAPYIRGTQSGVASLALAFGMPLIVSQQVAEGIAPENRPQVIELPEDDSTSLAQELIKFQAKASQSPILRIPAADDWQRLAQTVKGLAA